MKKKLLTFLLTACMVLCVSVGLTACGKHTHTLVHTEAVEAACTSAGNIEYWYCSDCEKYFSDKDAKTEITQEQTVISATGHNYEYTYNPTALRYDGVCSHDATHTTTIDAGASAEYPYLATSDTEVNTILEQEDEGVVYIKLNASFSADIVILEDKNVQLDLNGKTLTNETSHTITNNGTLQIVDSSADGTGIVDNTTAGTSALVNNGTVTLEGGKYTKTENSYYVIDNYGTLYVGTSSLSNVSVMTAVSGTSLIKNGWNSPEDRPNDSEVIATCIVEGGNFAGGLNNIKNDNYSSLTINGGLFTIEGTDSGYVNIMNYGEASINGGTFNNTATTTGNSQIANILNLYNENLGIAPSMTINGGTFECLQRCIYNDVANLVITNANFNSGSCAVYAFNSTTADSDVVVDVSGGVFVGNGGAALSVASGYQCSITGGSFTGTSYGVNIATATEATISNATITATATTGKGIGVGTANTNITISNTVVDAPNAIWISGRDIQVAITSGEFNGPTRSIYLSGPNTLTITSGVFSGAIDLRSGTLTISGGVFSVSPETYLADGYEVIQDQETDMYEVRESQNIEENDE